MTKLTAAKSDNGKGLMATEAGVLVSNVIRTNESQVWFAGKHLVSEHGVA